MRKLSISFVALLLCCINMTAQPRSESEAIQVAKEFLGKKGLMPKLSVVSQHKVDSQVRKRVARTRKAPAKLHSYYVINDEESNRFVIVSADEQLTTILGYSDKGLFGQDSIPEGLVDILDGYDWQYASYLRTSKKQSKTLRKVQAITPLIKSQWNQQYPYNQDCPKDPRYEGYGALATLFGIDTICVTGCVATAMAQVMNYYKYPIQGKGRMPEYRTATLGIPQQMDFSSTKIDWDNMTDTYDDNSTQIQIDAVAELMHACGVSVQMDYTATGSGATASDQAYALINYFGYNPNIRHYLRDYFSTEEWDSLLMADLEKGKPVLYSGLGEKTNEDGSTSKYGHAFILDGCDTEARFHVNWGYSGSYDGYYSLEALTPGDSDYKFNHEMVCNITPKEEGDREDSFYALTFTISDTDISVGQRTTATFTPYCMSVSANTYNSPFKGELGVGVFDTKWNFVKSLDVYDNFWLRDWYAGYTWLAKGWNASIIFDSSTFGEGSQYYIAPYAKGKNSPRPTLIRTYAGLWDYYLATVESGKVNLCRKCKPYVPPISVKVLTGTYDVSAFNFDTTRKDWQITISRVEGTDTVWISNIDPLVSENATVFGVIESNGAHIRIPIEGNRLIGTSGYIHNYSYDDDILVFVSHEDSTMSIQSAWGTVERDITGENSTQHDLTRYTFTAFKYAKPKPDIVETPAIIVNNRRATITCATVGAEIRYTIGGAAPDKQSALYEGAVLLTDNKTIKAIAYKGNTSSLVAIRDDIHEFKVNTPTFHQKGNRIEIRTSDPIDATIYYTKDGSKPDRTSTKYNPEKDVKCEGSTTITAFAVKDDWDDSDINDYVYTPIPDPEPDPDPTPDPIYEIAIENMIAGQLSSKIPSESISALKTLWVSGELNGTDIRLIREMATTGSLTDLNIQNAKIVSGGDAYYITPYDNYTTKENIVGEYMFNKCRNLITLILPNNISLIENFAFDGCENLKSLTVPTACREIEMMAIYNCKRLENVSLPSNLNKLDDTNFSQCPKLTAINVNAECAYFKSEDGVLYSKSGQTLLRYPIGKSETSFTIPSGVVTIGSYAFYHSNLEDILVPSTVTTIENTAFGYCKNIIQIEIPNSVTKIGMMAFDNCSKLSTIKLSENVSKIGMMTFSYCTSLQSFTIGKNVSDIDGTAFSGCASLKSFEVDDENLMLSSIEGVLYTRDGKKILKCPIALYSTSYVVPDGVEVIGEYAFQKCQNIERFTLPESLTTIETNAFSGCSMTSINLPSTVNSIGWMAFENCDKLETFIVPDAITKIPMMMLSGCDNLSYIYLPSRIKNVELSAFSRCMNLSTIYSDISDLASIEFEKSYDGKVNAFDCIDNECLWNVPKGSEISYTSRSWWVKTWNIVSHIPSGIKDSGNTAYHMQWQNGTLVLNALSNGTVNIYAINGSLLKHLIVKGGGEYRIELPCGAYIINNKKIMIK